MNKNLESYDESEIRSKEDWQLTFLEERAKLGEAQRENTELLMKNIDLTIKYYELKSWITERGIIIPDDLHQKREQSKSEADILSIERECKKILRSLLEDYKDID